MARWLVQLSGERFDLEEFPRWFPDGEIYAIEENGVFFLVGSALDALPDVEAVLAEAARTLDRFTAVISLLEAGLQRPVVYGVVREFDGGRRDAFAMISAVISAQSKVGALIASTDTPQKPRQKTQAQEMVCRSKGKPHLELALSLWADPLRSWPRLYRVLEEIEQHLGRSVDAAAMCSANQRERFKRTANTAEASGVDARHATGKFIPPRNPMTLPEAITFVGEMLVRVVQSP